jgi:cell division protein FtsB
MKIFEKLLNIKFALLIFTALIVVGIFHNHGLIYVINKKKDINKIKNQQIILQKSNIKYKDKIKALKINEKLIEELARTELGMVKKNEVIYQLK